MSLKKLVVLLAAFGVLFSLAACDSRSGETPNEPVAPDRGGSGETTTSSDAPESETLTLTVPKMERVQNVEVPTGSGDDERLLKENAAVHLLHTGYPWEDEANVYIAGHRLGYEDTDSYLAFYDIDRLDDGDEILVTDSDGGEYTYEVFETLTVEPTELQVLDPIDGKNIISLQACTLPDYSDRIVVRGELVES